MGVLTEDPQAAYLAMSDMQRRTFNQAWWNRIFIGEGDEVRGEMAEPFELLYDRELHSEARAIEAKASSFTQPPSQPSRS